jgi:hypothetical protein
MTTLSIHLASPHLTKPCPQKPRNLHKGSRTRPCHSPWSPPCHTCSLSSPLSLTMSWKLASLPCTCWREPWPVDARHHPERDMVTVLGLASMRIGMVLGVPVHLPVPIDPDDLLPSPGTCSFPSTSASSRTPPIGRRRPVDDALVAVLRRSTARSRGR